MNWTPQRDQLNRFLAAVAIMATLSVERASEALAQDSPNMFPGLEADIQRLRFHTGRKVNNQPEISPVLPNIPGSPSPWVVSQWSQQEILSGDRMTQDEPLTRDLRLGLAKYAFTASDGHSHIWIYQNSKTNRPVYELYERDGQLTSSGGTDLFLGREAMSGGISLDQTVEYRLDAKLSKAAVQASGTAQRSGVVLAQVFTGFVVQFPELQDGLTSTIFLQLPIATSVPQVDEYRACQAYAGQRIIVFDGLQNYNSKLDFKPDNGPLKHLIFNVNDYLCELLNKPIFCKNRAGKSESWAWPTGTKILHDWKITAMYVGLETENRDLRPQFGNSSPQGSIEVALQLANLRVYRTSSSSSRRKGCKVGN